MEALAGDAFSPPGPYHACSKTRSLLGHYLEAWSIILIPSEVLRSRYIGYPSFLSCGLSILPAEIGRQLVVARISVDLQPSVPLEHPEH